jgi:plasmid stability protein
MTRLSIDLPEDVRVKLEARASRAGHTSVEEYVRALLQDEAAEDNEDFGAPAHLTFTTEEELEAMLVRRIEDSSGSVEATPEFWANLKRQAAEHRAKGG